MSNELVFPGAMNEGLLLRDYFAAKAMLGLIATTNITLFDNNPENNRCIARMAYAIADAMLKARDAQTPKTT